EADSVAGVIRRICTRLKSHVPPPARSKSSASAASTMTGSGIDCASLGRPKTVWNGDCCEPLAVEGEPLEPPVVADVPPPPPRLPPPPDWEPGPCPPLWSRASSARWMSSAALEYCWMRGWAIRCCIALVLQASGHESS